MNQGENTIQVHPMLKKKRLNKLLKAYRGGIKENEKNKGKILKKNVFA